MVRVLLRFQIRVCDLAYFVDLDVHLLYLQRLLLASWSVLMIKECNSRSLNKYSSEQSICLYVFFMFLDDEKFEKHQCNLQIQY
jgi:hypothetical protein